MLPWEYNGPRQGAMPRPGIPVQRPEIRDNLGAERVQADQLEEVGLLLDHDGIAAILEEVPHPL